MFEQKASHPSSIWLTDRNSETNYSPQFDISNGSPPANKAATAAGGRARPSKSLAPSGSKSSHPILPSAVIAAYYPPPSPPILPPIRYNNSVNSIEDNCEFDEDEDEDEDEDGDDSTCSESVEPVLGRYPSRSAAVSIGKGRTDGAVVMGMVVVLGANLAVLAVI